MIPLTEEFQLRLACHLEDKPVSITFRASERLSKLLEQRARSGDVNVSTYIRELLYEALRP